MLIAIRLMPLVAVLMLSACKKEWLHKGLSRAPEKSTKIRGVNLGGLFVLEPWIRPSLFNQFQGKQSPSDVGLDSYTFCKVLKKEANAQLREHWQSWVTKDDIKKIAELGLNTIRLPLGDYMFRPYGPYSSDDTSDRSKFPSGDTLPKSSDCFAGSLDYLDQVLAWANEYKLSVHLDLHTTWGGQNGFDNGGQASDLIWLGEGLLDTAENWQSAGAYIHKFVPHWGPKATEHLLKRAHTLATLKDIASKYSDKNRYPAVVGITALNEPLWDMDLEWLKAFYQDAYAVVKNNAPDWIIIFHDSFRLNQWVHNIKLPKSYDQVVFSTHIYQAFDGKRHKMASLKSGMADNARMLNEAQNLGPNVIVDEWSLAVDNCMMWINGFNSRVQKSPGQCQSVSCPTLAPMAYKNRVITSAEQGLGPTTLGTCPIDNLADIDMKALAQGLIYNYETNSLGWIFWNFKTELESPAWSYFAAVDKGYFPADGSKLATFKALLK